VWERNLSGGKSNVQEWNVTEDSNQDSLEGKTKVTEAVDHTLLSEGEVSSLADHQISPLDTDDGDQVTGLGELKGFSGVANRPVGDDGVSVEPWDIVVIRLPSASGVRFGSSERLVGGAWGLSSFSSVSVRVVKSDINS